MPIDKERGKNSAKTQTFEQHTGCTWQSMLAICHSVHTCTPHQTPSWSSWSLWSLSVVIVVVAAAVHKLSGLEGFTKAREKLESQDDKLASRTLSELWVDALHGLACEC